MHVSPADVGRVPWLLKPFFWNQKRKYGKHLQSALVWARSPKLFMGVAVLYGMIDRRSSPVEPVLRSLLTVRVSQINWCHFCVDLNSATLLKRGAARDKLEALADWRGSDLFDERERIALDYAERMTFTDGVVDEAVIERLRAHFDEEGVVELTGLIAFQNMSSKFNAALAVPPQGFCRVPQQHEAARERLSEAAE